MQTFKGVKLSKAEILLILETSTTPLNFEQFKEKLNISNQSIYKNLRKLKKDNNVTTIIINGYLHYWKVKK